MKKFFAVKPAAVVLSLGMLLGIAPAAGAESTSVSVPVGLEQNIDIASVKGEVTEFYAKNESGTGLYAWSVGQELNGEYTDLTLSVTPEREGTWTFSYEYTYTKSSGKTGSASGSIEVKTDGYVPATPTPAPTEEPEPEPTKAPTPEPTEEPTPEPTEEPTPEPTEEPTPEPTEEPEQPYEPTVEDLESFSALAAMQYGLDEHGAERDGQIYAMSLAYNVTGDIPCLVAERAEGTMTVEEDELAKFFKSATGTKFIRTEADSDYLIGVSVVGTEYTFTYANDPVSVNIVSYEKNGDEISVFAQVTPGLEAETADVQITVTPVDGYLGFRLA